jgi:hypothetical protein
VSVSVPKASACNHESTAPKLVLFQVQNSVVWSILNLPSTFKKEDTAYQIRCCLHPYEQRATVIWRLQNLCTCVIGHISF